jgi:hypothetical protein
MVDKDRNPAVVLVARSLKEANPIVSQAAEVSVEIVHLEEEANTPTCLATHD